MYSTGHYGVSLTLYAPVLAGLLLLDLPILGLIGLLVVIYTAPLPDIDLKTPFRYIVGHRTWTHSLWFAILVGLLTGTGAVLLAPVLPNHGGVGLFNFGFIMGIFGIFGHLAGDVLTHSGIRPLYPIGPKYSIHLTSAKGLWWFENPKSGNQNELTTYESIRHTILNSNRVFLVMGLIACALASMPYTMTV